LTISGTTEDEKDQLTAAPALDEGKAGEPVLSVLPSDGGRFSLIARGQTVAGILFEVAVALGIPFDMKAAESPEIGTVDVRGIDAHGLLAMLPEGAGLDARVDLATGTERPLRLFFMGKPQ
jgi:hypothetical protein